MSYNEVDLYFQGKLKQRAIYDSNREILILNWMSTKFAKDFEFTWKDRKEENNMNSDTTNYEVKEAYSRGLHDAWDCLRKIIGLGEPSSIVEGAGLRNFVCKYSASEAIRKLQEYEESMEVSSGDEIISSDGNTAVVTSMGSADNNWCCVGSNGCTFVLSRDKIKEFNWHRTGRHFPQLADMLNQLKEKENE